MSVTVAAGQANPSWWAQSNPSGEADPAGAETGGTDNSMGFADFLDVINPLQHIPVVSTLYRELTGDTMSEAARMAGGALWGGPAGVIGALANTITNAEAGGDIGATALAYLRGEEIGPAAQDGATMVAEAAPSQPIDPDAPVSDTVAQFAGIMPLPAAGAAGNPGAVQASAAVPPGAQEFSGSAANRLDAFIQRANAVRTPALAPARGPSGKGLTIEVTPADAKSPPARVQNVQATSAAPLKLASDGNTDVAHWMMRALDRYDTMKTDEKS